MKKLLFALLLAIALYTPANAATDGPDNGGTKKPVGFEILNTEGYRELYGPGEQVAFQVEGKSPEPFAVAPQSGFHVQAMIVSEKQSSPFVSVNGSYNEEKHAWLVTFAAPKEASNAYQLVISLYCALETGSCAETYGQAAQIQKSLPLQVH